MQKSFMHLHIVNNFFCAANKLNFLQNAEVSDTTGDTISTTARNQTLTSFSLATPL